MQNLNAARKGAVVHQEEGPAHGPVGPEVFNLFALRGDQVLASVQAQQNRVQFAVFLHVIQQPGVLHLQGGRRHGPAQEIEVLYLVKV